MHSAYADACHFDVKNKEIRASVMSPPFYNFLRSTNGLTAHFLFDLRGKPNRRGASNEAVLSQYLNGFMFLYLPYNWLLKHFYFFELK